MANYAPVFLHGKKIVFMRHPYLVNGIKRKKGIQDFFDIEAVRRGLFRLTLLSSDLIVVQSDYMRRRLYEKFGRSAGVHILPNPVSNLLKIRDPAGQKESPDSRAVLYVSRFYPHKAHWFLLKLADKHQRRFREAGIKFYVTVAPSSRSARIFLRELESRGLTDIICNIGEVSNKDLTAYYRAARCIFYPSRFETFGNPLVEAMAFNLPLVVPDAAYAHAVCGDAGIYFQPGSIDDACHKLMRVLIDNDICRQFSQKSARRLGNFPAVENWLKQ
ncbi:MAG: glycosyltransferase, partial [Desulfobacterales bacterium]